MLRKLPGTLFCCGLTLGLVWITSPCLQAQAVPTASRRADLQIGLGFTTDRSDYDTSLLHGLAFYTTLDLTNRLGLELDFHQANSHNGDKVYQRTYEVGGRYHRDYGRFTPYARVMYGRGVFNYPFDSANLAYNLVGLGGGVDFKVISRINVRADYEYQKWFSFQPSGLTPQLVTIGVAYHFPGALQSGKHIR